MSISGRNDFSVNVVRFYEEFLSTDLPFREYKSEVNISIITELLNFVIDELVYLIERKFVMTLTNDIYRFYDIYSIYSQF